MLVIKLAKDKNVYMCWSFVVDAPTFFGRREDIAQELSLDYTVRDIQSGYAAERIELALTRCDETGTSSMVKYNGEWDESGLPYMNLGTLPRKNFYKMYERYVAEPDNKTPDITDLLILRET